MKQFFTILLLLPTLLLGGCLTEANQGDEAAKIVTAVHDAFKTGNWDKVMPLYEDQFLHLHPAAAWQASMRSLTAPLGALKNIKPTFQQKDPRFRGDFYLYGYLLQFEHGSVSETLTIYKGVDKDHMTISGHQLKLKRHP